MALRPEDAVFRKKSAEEQARFKKDVLDKVGVRKAFDIWANESRGVVSIEKTLENISSGLGEASKKNKKKIASIEKAMAVFYIEATGFVRISMCIEQRADKDKDTTFYNSARTMFKMTMRRFSSVCIDWIAFRKEVFLTIEGTAREKRIEERANGVGKFYSSVSVEQKHKVEMKVIPTDKLYKMMREKNDLLIQKRTFVDSLIDSISMRCADLDQKLLHRKETYVKLKRQENNTRKKGSEFSKLLEESIKHYRCYVGHMQCNYVERVVPPSIVRMQELMFCNICTKQVSLMPCLNPEYLESMRMVKGKYQGEKIIRNANKAYCPRCSFSFCLPCFYEISRPFHEGSDSGPELFGVGYRCPGCSCFIVKVAKKLDLSNPNIKNEDVVMCFGKMSYMSQKETPKTNLSKGKFSVGGKLESSLGEAINVPVESLERILKSPDTIIEQMKKFEEEQKEYIK
jgi:hypothetical protein